MCTLMLVGVFFPCALVWFYCECDKLALFTKKNCLIYVYIHVKTRLLYSKWNIKSSFSSLFFSTFARCFFSLELEHSFLFSSSSSQYFFCVRAIHVSLQHSVQIRIYYDSSYFRILSLRFSCIHSNGFQKRYRYKGMRRPIFFLLSFICLAFVDTNNSVYVFFYCISSVSMCWKCLLILCE